MCKNNEKVIIFEQKFHSACVERGTTKFGTRGTQRANGAKTSQSGSFVWTWSETLDRASVSWVSLPSRHVSITSLNVNVCKRGWPFYRTLSGGHEPCAWKERARSVSRTNWFSSLFLSSFFFSFPPECVCTCAFARCRRCTSSSFTVLSRSRRGGLSDELARAKRSRTRRRRALEES